jgi:hypothetical protein
MRSGILLTEFHNLLIILEVPVKLDDVFSRSRMLKKNDPQKLTGSQ